MKVKVLARIPSQPLVICIAQTDFYHRDVLNAIGSPDATLRAPLVPSV